MSSELQTLRQAVLLGQIVWQKHALARMLERGIARRMVFACLQEGSIIERYAGDKPLPSVLILGFPEGEPLHVVAAYDEREGAVYVITVYRPDEKHFEADFRTRRSQ